MPKEIYSSKLGTVKLYSVEELAELMKLPPGEVSAKLKSGELKAQQIKGGWHVPDDVIAEQSKLINRVSAAGARIKGNKKARTSAFYASIGVVALVVIIALIAIFKPEPVIADACDSPGMEGFVLEALSDSALLMDIKDIVQQACAEGNIEDSSDAFMKCSEFVKRPKQGIEKLTYLIDVQTKSSGAESLFCAAMLKAATVPMSVEYVVTVNDGVAKSASVSLMK